MKFKSFVALSALAGVGGYCYYTYGLSDQQREEIERRVAQIRTTAERIGEQIKPLVEKATHPAEQGNDHANKERTRQQWESLGF